MKLINFVLETILFFKSKNFTVTKEFDMGGVKVKEYVYNMKKFFTDVWPPVSTQKGLPIKSVVREKDGLDVTEMVLKFSGPKKNYINPVSLFTKKKRVVVSVVNFGLRVTLSDVWVPYNGNVTITDILGFKKTIPIEYKKENGACISSR